MIGFVYHVARTARPRQWLKNLALLAAPVFAGVLFEQGIALQMTKAFICFCAIASAGYYINDIVDAPKDRLHPVKKNRAIASGKISTKLAWIIAWVTALFAILFGYVFVGRFFSFMVIAYLVLQLIYSFYIRNVIILDALTVATLFIFRVVSGALAVEVSVSSWLILATIGLSLLLAFGKRRSEKTLLMQHQKDSKLTRETLRHYPDTLLDSMISMSASFCIITYALFTFQVSPESLDPTIAQFLPSILRGPKLMMLSIPIVIYGVARYLYVIYEKKEGESPARVLLSDKPLLVSVVIWGLFIVGLVNLPPFVGKYWDNKTTKSSSIKESQRLDTIK